MEKPRKPSVDRRGFLTVLTDTELADIRAYLASLPPPPPVADIPLLAL